jgi:hypothetical protein
MQQHASIMDVFNAASRAASPFLQQGTAELQAQNDLRLRNDATRFTNDMQNWLRDNPYTGDFDKYLGKLQGRVSEWYGTETAGNTSEYYRRNIEAMRQQSMEFVRGHAEAEQDRWRVEQEHISRDNDIKGYMEIEGWTPQMIVDSINNRINLSLTQVDISPLEQDKMRRGYQAAYYQQYAMKRLGAVTDAIDLESAMQQIRDDFSFMPEMTIDVYGADGKVTGTEQRAWGFEGRDDFEEKLLQRETARIQDAHFSEVQEQQAYLDRLIVSGNIQAAIDFAKLHGAEWNKAYNTDHEREFANYSNDHRTRGRGFFDWRSLEAHQRAGTEREKWIEYNWRNILTGALSGGGVEINGKWESNASLAEGIDNFLGLEEKAFFEQHGNQHNAYTHQMWQNEKSALMKQFYSELKTVLDTVPGNEMLKLSWDKFTKADTYVSDSDFNEQGRRLSGEELTAYQQTCISFFKSLFFINGITDAATLETEMKQFTGRALSRLLNDTSIPDSPAAQIIKHAEISQTLMSEATDDLVFRQFNPEKYSVTGDGSVSDIIFRDDNQHALIERERNYDHGRLARMLGVPMNELDMGWMPSGKRKGDVIGKGIFTVKGDDGPEAYFLGYDEHKNEVVMRINLDSGETEATDISAARPLTRSEAVIRRRDFALMIGRGIDPLTGQPAEEPIDLATPPPGISPADYSQMVHRMTHRTTRSVLAGRSMVWANYYLRLLKEKEMES